MLRQSAVACSLGAFEPITEYFADDRCW